VLELGGKLVLDSSDTVAAAGNLGELASALKNLGFKPAQVEKTLRELEEDSAEDEKFEVLLRRALKVLQGNR
jgi:Holliday junction resolvasome RuvABC DNA-binding subunit